MRDAAIWLKRAEAEGRSIRADNSELASTSYRFNAFCFELRTWEIIGKR